LIVMSGRHQIKLWKH